ncbi:MAG: hypothetical protein ABFD49_07205 [Armatimonadota bacterium]|nr:hypothetical protein [bacterium]
MDRLVYKYNFAKHVPVDDIEDSLMIAALAAEALHGRAAVKMDAYFCLDKKNRTCVVDAGTSIGCDIARILSTFVTRGYGESSFKVERAQEHYRNRGQLCVTGAAM